MKTLNFLASANTSNGFENHFNSIFPNEKSFVYILKGGPGTGKSTFMKKVGKYYSDKGFDVEYFYCSSDPKSLDGVRIVQKDICIVDGTAPHVTECTIPGAKEVIVNLGAAIKSGIKENLREIVPLLAEKKKYFDLAYCYLHAAGKVFEISKKQHKLAVNVNIEAQKIFSQLPLSARNYSEKARQLYLSYFTSTGLKSVENNFERTIKLQYSYFDGLAVLKQLAEFSKKSGHDVIQILSPISTSELEGVYFPTINTYVTLDENAMKSIADRQILTSLLKKGGKCIERARSCHLQIEKYYIKNMNFQKIDEMYNDVIAEIDNC